MQKRTLNLLQKTWRNSEGIPKCLHAAVAHGDPDEPQKGPPADEEVWPPITYTAEQSLPTDCQSAKNRCYCSQSCQQKVPRL